MKRNKWFRLKIFFFSNLIQIYSILYKSLTKSQTLTCNDQTKSEKTTDSPSLFKNNLKFAVFGLGNSSYPKYCAYAKFLDCCLAESGAERIHCIGLGDELCGQEESFRKWSISVFKVNNIINYLS